MDALGPGVLVNTTWPAPAGTGVDGRAVPGDGGGDTDEDRGGGDAGDCWMYRVMCARAVPARVCERERSLTSLLTRQSVLSANISAAEQAVPRTPKITLITVSVTHKCKKTR
jgi:hypothetical protein